MHENIMKLLDAGFTADEIRAMGIMPTAPAAPAPAAPAPAAPAPTAPAPAAPAPAAPAPAAPAPAAPAPAAPAAPAQDPAAFMAPVLQQLQQLTQQLQASAIGASRQPQPETPEQILASIINPPTRA